MRGICALTVFLSHVVLWSNLAPRGVIESWLQRGLTTIYEVFTVLTWPTGGQHPAVICFFVLSGFCVHGPFESRITRDGPAVAWGTYFVRRTRRIMPVYWAGGLLGLLVVMAMRWRPVADQLLMLHSAATPAQMAARLGGYGGLWHQEIFAGNYTLGTVAVEILIYLAYPLFFLAAAAGRWRLLGGIALGLQLLALALQPFVNPYVLFSSVLVMAFFWYLGALAAHGRQTLGWQVSGWWIVATWALFLGLKAIPHFYGLNMVKQAVWGVVCMQLVAWLPDWEKRHEASRVRGWARLLRWSGEISYPLYAVHTPMILLVNWAMLATADSRSYPGQLALNLVGSVAIAVAVHRGIEKRFYRQRAVS